MTTAPNAVEEESGGWAGSCDRTFSRWQGWIPVMAAMIFVGVCWATSGKN